MLAKIVPFLAVALIGTKARAMPPPATEALQAEGFGCPQGSVQSNLSPSGQSDFTFELRLTRMAAATAGQPDAETNCHLSVVVRPPVGYRMRIASHLLHGSHNTPEGGQTELAGSYSCGLLGGEQPAPMRFEVRPNDPDGSVDAQGFEVMKHGLDMPISVFDVNLVPVPHGDDFSPCNDRGDLALLLQSNLELAGHRGSQGQEADIELDRSATTTSIGWGWYFEPCGAPQPQPSWFAGSWSSHYADPSGQQVQAWIDTDGSQGTYRTGSWTGHLYGIQTNGANTHGLWSAQGQSGWFDFQIQPDGRSFGGAWGFQQNQPIGRWTGRR